MKLYIVRHGQTDWNYMQRFQGQVNIPLNELGREQTLILKEAIKDLSYDIIYTSPLNRCTEMAHMINEDKTEILIEPLIIEMAFGIYEGESFADPSAFTKDHPFYNYYFDRPNYVPPAGGESFADILTRVENFLEKISKEHQGQTILAFSHGAFIRSMISLIEQNPEDAKRRIPSPNNCSVTVISHDSGKFVVEQNAVDILEGEELIIE